MEDVVEMKKSVKDGKLDLRVFVRLIIEKLMGESLDLFKISGISPVALEQVSRTIKRDYNSVINNATAILEKYGYCDPLVEGEVSEEEDRL